MKKCNFQCENTFIFWTKLLRSKISPVGNSIIVICCVKISWNKFNLPLGVSNLLSLYSSINLCTMFDKSFTTIIKSSSLDSKKGRKDWLIDWLIVQWAKICCNNVAFDVPATLDSVCATSRSLYNTNATSLQHSVLTGILIDCEWYLKNGKKIIPRLSLLLLPPQNDIALKNFLIFFNIAMLIPSRESLSCPCCPPSTSVLKSGNCYHVFYRQENISWRQILVKDFKLQKMQKNKTKIKLNYKIKKIDNFLWNKNKYLL